MPNFTFEKQVRVIEVFLQCRELWDRENPDIYGTIVVLKKAQVFSPKYVARDLSFTIYNYIAFIRALEKAFKKR